MLAGMAGAPAPDPQLRRDHASWSAWLLGPLTYCACYLTALLAPGDTAETIVWLSWLPIVVCHLFAAWFTLVAFAWTRTAGGHAALWLQSAYWAAIAVLVLAVAGGLPLRLAPPAMLAAAGIALVIPFALLRQRATIAPPRARSSVG